MKTLVAITLFFNSLHGTNFMPENNLDQEISLNADAGLTQEQFNKVISDTEKVYQPIFKKFGVSLKVEKHWRDNTVNAYAQQNSPTEWEVHMFGGLARRPEVTQDGFALVLCHELGHHLSGFPFVTDWAANEGQSDMHATGACAQKIFTDNTQLSLIADDVVPDLLKKKCDLNFKTAKSRDICARSLAAGKSLATLLAVLKHEKVSFDTPDTSVVNVTDNEHPAAQCRLDTFVAAALCGASKWDYDLIPGKDLDHESLEAQTEAFNHSCPDGEGSRPKCWFAALE
jgi:hypothetical protein